MKKGGKFGFAASTYIDLSKVAFTPEIVSPEYMATSKERTVSLTMDEYICHATANNFEVLFAKERSHRWKYADAYKYIDALRMRMDGDFDMSHFDIDAVRHHFGDDEVSFSLPFGIALLQKR